ncbi:MAG: InlB B-repeat-containing protein, partial [Ruminococcus sp.]|nr:InlB B-repeat-containing protein [Ruminococcus sp.]
MRSNKRLPRKLISMILALVMILSVSVLSFGPVAAADSTDTKTIYLSINGQWTQKLCAVYTWGEDYNAGQWLAMSSIDGATDLWSVDIPASYSNITFCSRTAPIFDWANVRNQTGELTIPNGCDRFTLTGETAGVWDNYDTGTDTEVGTRVLYFAPNTEWMDIQASEGHNFVAHAYNTTTDAAGVYIDMTLVQGSYGVHPAIWAAEVSEAYTNIEFFRGEGTYTDGSWKLWESTNDYTIPADSNLFTQDEELCQIGEWSYIDAPQQTEPEVTEPEATEPEATEPEVTDPEVTDPVETKKIYFTPNDAWLTAVSGSGAFCAYSWSTSADTGSWVWLTAVGSVYSADIPADSTNIFFAISYSTEPDAVWNQTDNLTIPADSNHFTQDSSDFTTGTWHATEVSGNTYYVVFVDSNGKLISAQTVKEGEAATAPDAPQKSGYTFTGWDTEFSAVMSDLTVTAIYEKNAVITPSAPTIGTLKVEVAGGTGFTISMNGGAARPQGTSYNNSKAPIGADVTVTANTIEELEFMGWYDPINGQVLSADYSYSFTTSGNDFVKAMYKVDVEGVSSVVFLNDKASGGLGQVLDMQYYAAGDDIVVPADPAQVGYDFAGWNMTVEEIQAEIAAGNNVTVIANWTRQIVKVQVTVTGGSGTGQYNANAAVTVVANTAPEGQRFAYWTIDGVVKSYSETLKFYPTSDCQVEAVFVAEDAEIEYQILVNVDTIDTTSIAD